MHMPQTACTHVTSGAHHATEAPFDTELQDLDYTAVATGHGPIIRYNQDELIGRQLSFPVSHEDLQTLSFQRRAVWDISVMDS